MFPLDIKVGLSLSKKIVLFASIKKMRIAFYFILQALFVLNVLMLLNFLRRKGNQTNGIWSVKVDLQKSHDSKIRSLSMPSISCWTIPHVFTSFARLKKVQLAQRFLQSLANDDVKVNKNIESLLKKIDLETKLIVWVLMLLISQSES